jgi:hypothetical protein
VVGRVLTFADPEIIKLARDEFVAVAADDWYQRRRQDAEGEFFRKVADQGPRKGQGGSTRQGIYIFTASGQLLIYRNHQDAEVMKNVIRQGIKEWKKLPAGEREPGAIKVAELSKVDKTYWREPPKGTVIVNVHTRILDKTDQGAYCHGTCGFPGGDRAAHDHLWLTPDDCKALIPANPRQGAKIKLPDRITLRIARFHLVDNTRGEPPHWRRGDVRAAQLFLTVEDVNDKGMTLRLEGGCLLATAADAATAERGYDVHLQGTIHIDAAGKVIDRLDVVAVGEHWGSGSLTSGARPGRTPLGVAFSLARGGQQADRVPPQAARDYRNYSEAER